MQVSKGMPRLGVGLAAMVVALVASTAAAQTAQEVIAKSAEAQGGRDALMNLKSVQRKGTVAVDGAFGQMEGSVEEAIVPFKKALRNLDLAVFVQKEGWNGKTAWREGMNGLQDLEGDEANLIKQVADLNPLLNCEQRGLKVEKLDDETVDDVGYYVLKLSTEGGIDIKVYVNKDTNLVTRSTLTQNNPQFGEVQIVMENKDYEQFGPVKLPKKNKIQLGEILQIETTYSDTKVNEEIDEKIFEKPEEAAAAN